MKKLDQEFKVPKFFKGIVQKIILSKLNSLKTLGSCSRPAKGPND